MGGLAVGAATGAVVGGTAGSVVPGVGTVVVGVVAGVVGGIGGAIAGEEAAKRWGQDAVGWMTGIDDKFETAMQGLDAQLKPFLDKNRDGIVEVSEVHALLKRTNNDSLEKLDTNKDGTLAPKELNAKIRASVAALELMEKIPELQAKGWGNVLGDKDGKLTVKEVIAVFKGTDMLAIDTNRNGNFSGKEITDAIQQRLPKPSPAQPANQHVPK